jgi:uncharacterized phage protein (TIGR02220 family)
MARPQKIGLDYFPVDTNISDDDKIFYIESEHGIVGFGVFIKLLTKIYDNSYFIEWNKFRQNVFARKFNVDINIVLDVINVALECGLFNEKLYKNYTILTSSAIQNRYLKAVSRRSNVDLVEEFSLIDVNEYNNITLVGVNVYNNYDSTLINVDIGTQRRGQDSREQERKEEEDTSVNNSDGKSNEKKKNKKIISNIIEYLNLISDKSYKNNSKLTIKYINARIEDGFVLDDFKNVIDIKTKQWKNDKNMSKFIRPETLFSNKFEGYLNEKPFNNDENDTNEIPIDMIDFIPEDSD